MYKKVSGSRTRSKPRTRKTYDNPLPEKREAKGNDIRLIRPKSRFDTSAQALKDILDKHHFNPNKLTPKHTKKAWRWIHKQA